MQQQWAAGAHHSGVPAWLLEVSHVERRTLDSPKSHTCAAAVSLSAAARVSRPSAGVPHIRSPEDAHMQ